MMYATVNNQKVTAEPNQHGICPHCGAKTISKCGQIIRWHWAHAVGAECYATEPETEWHLQWKSLFPAEWVERTVTIGGVTKRADVLLPDGTAVELQHSSISPDEIHARESHYRRVIWLFDATEAYANDRLSIRDKGEYCTFRWKHGRKTIEWASEKYIDTKPATWYGIFRISKMYTNEGCAGWGKWTPWDIWHPTKMAQKFKIDSLQPSLF
jgi:competence protein CoiA